ncbi:MAG: adenylate/guanylate cyclase domain-containing protein [Rhodocyclaceae bacterium]
MPRRLLLHPAFLTVLLIAALLPLLTPVKLLELKWLDAQFRLLREHAPLAARHQLAIVGIDDATPRALGMPLSLMHVQLGSVLTALAAVRPEAVAIDVALPEMSFDAVKPGLDAALARGIIVLRDVAPLVLGVAVDGQGRPRPLHKPFALLAGESGLGYVLVPLDIDNVLRRFDEQLGSAGESVPTLAGQVARRLGVEPRAGLVQYALGEDLRYVPLQQVLAWHAAGATDRLVAAFGGKIVVLGSVLSFEDRHRVPVSLAQWEPDARFVPGVAVHAQQILSLVEQRMVSSPPTLAIILGATLATGLWWQPAGRRALVLLTLLIVLVLVAGLAALRAGVHLPVATWSLAMLMAVGGRIAHDAWRGLREKRRLRAAFAGWVSPAVLQEILAGRLSPGLHGQRRDVAVMFCDIRQFTHLSEALPPEQVTTLLNRYFNHMARVIHGQRGTIDKFIGDGIMAFFGAPQFSANPCREAFYAAREMAAELAKFNRELAAEGRAPLAFGIGLHAGPAVIGYVGAVERYEYTAIGDTVNTASRIEGLTKEMGWMVLLSKAVADRLDDVDDLTYLGEHAVKGRAAVEVFGWRPAPPAGSEVQ